MSEKKAVHIEVKGMTCQGCVNAVTRVVQRKDPAAQVTVDLAAGRMDCVSEVEQQTLAAAITAAGYEARVL